MARSIVLTPAFILIIAIFQVTNAAISWKQNQYGSWAYYCNWTTGIDLISASIPSGNCASFCAITPKCTHYHYSFRNGNTCSLRTFGTLKSAAIEIIDSTSFCGVIGDGVDLFTKWSVDKNSFLSCDWNGPYLYQSKALAKDKCFPLCQQINGCTMYSWSTTLGCRLYSGVVDKTLMFRLKDTNAICGYVSYTGIIWNGDFAQPCEFTDFNDISNFVDSLFSCQRICSSSSVCTHYNWIPIASSTQGTCFMKSGTIRKEQAVSSSSNVNNTCGIVNGGIDWSNINYALPCDWSGIVLTVLFQIPNPNTCASRCRQFSGCTRYTYSLGTCWLRGGAVSLSTAINSYNTRDNNMVCGYVSNGIVWNKNLAFGCDWNDTVVATNTTILWYQCESICIHNSSCTHWTWTTQNGGTCQLRKGAINRTQAVVTVEDPWRVCGIVFEGIDWRFVNYASFCNWSLSSSDGATLITSTAATGTGCLSKCTSPTQQPVCNFWSWSPPNTCRLFFGVIDKSKLIRSSDQAQMCGFNPKGSLVWFGSWTSLCNISTTITTSVLIKSQEKITFIQCIDSCKTSTICTHFLWIPDLQTPNGTCFTKSGAMYKANFIYDANSSAYCGLDSDGVEWLLTSENNLNMVGIYALNCDWSTTTIAKLPSTGPNDCEAQCLRNPSPYYNCTHYTYTSKLCKLKTGLVDMTNVIHTSVQDMVCGYVQTGVIWYNDWARSCYFRTGTDLSNSTVPADQCASLCINTLPCSNYVWLPPLNSAEGTCYLKQGFVTKSDAIYDGNPFSICGIPFMN